MGVIMLAYNCPIPPFEKLDFKCLWFDNHVFVHLGLFFNKIKVTVNKE